MRTKRFLGQLVMIAALAVMTAGVMPAPTAVENIGTYGEQSSIGSPFSLMWIVLGSFVVTIP
jgi:hypothetical protein